MLLTSKMKVFVVLLACGLQPSTNVTKNSVLGVEGVLIRLWNSITCSKICTGVKKLSKIAGLLYYFGGHIPIIVSHIQPKASTSPQLKHSTFVCVTFHFPHTDHSVTL